MLRIFSKQWSKGPPGNPLPNRLRTRFAVGAGAAAMRPCVVSNGGRLGQRRGPRRPTRIVGPIIGCVGGSSPEFLWLERNGGFTLAFHHGGRLRPVVTRMDCRDVGKMIKSETGNGTVFVPLHLKCQVFRILLKQWPWWRRSANDPPSDHKLGY
jgi:hypothetical protein